MEKKRYRLIALDMDGTLLTSEKTIAPDTIQDIRAAAAQGVEVVYCTGRALPELYEYFDVVPVMRYAVCTSGAVVYDRVEDRCMDAQPVSREMAARLLAVAAEYDAMPHFLTRRESIVAASDVTHMADFHMGIYQSMFERIARQTENMAREVQALDFIAKVNLYFRSPEDRQACYEKLRELPLAFALPEHTTLEATALGVTKASGLRLLAEHLRIPMAQTVGIGDSDNDRAMLCEAGLGVAMGNALPELKAQCAMVTTDNDHNGVGEAIRRILAE